MNFDKGNGLLFVFGYGNVNEILQKESREYADEVSKEVLEYVEVSSDREILSELKEISRNDINHGINEFFENFEEKQTLIVIEIDLARMESANRLPI